MREQPQMISFLLRGKRSARDDAIDWSYSHWLLSILSAGRLKGSTAAESTSPIVISDQPDWWVHLSVSDESRCPRKATPISWRSFLLLSLFYHKIIMGKKGNSVEFVQRIRVFRVVIIRHGLGVHYMFNLQFISLDVTLLLISYSKQQVYWYQTGKWMSGTRWECLLNMSLIFRHGARTFWNKMCRPMSICIPHRKAIAWNIHAEMSHNTCFYRIV